MITIRIDTIDKINKAAKEFLKVIKNERIIAFEGEMGAGKTTFIKAICQELGVENIATSPTFALVNEYVTKDGGLIYHFDFYRINRIEEAYDIGYEEYFYSGNYCFIEWPEKIEELLPEDVLRVKIKADTTGARIITVN